MTNLAIGGCIMLAVNIIVGAAILIAKSKVKEDGA